MRRLLHWTFSTFPYYFWISFLFFSIFFVWYYRIIRLNSSNICILNIDESGHLLFAIFFIPLVQCRHAVYAVSVCWNIHAHTHTLYSISIFRKSKFIISPFIILSLFNLISLRHMSLVRSFFIENYLPFNIRSIRFFPVSLVALYFFCSVLFSFSLSLARCVCFFLFFA